MRLFITILIFISFTISSFCQIKVDEELGLKLEGKTKFQDIKTTVWSHLNGKLASLDTKDSVGRKAIMRQMKKWNRLFWINEYYTDGNGEVEPQSKVIMNALAKRKREKRKEGLRGQTEGWVSNGPYDCDSGIGRIDRIAFHPTNPDILYAGSPHGGLFKSANGGNNWEPISEYVASLGVAGIAIYPLNPNIIYVFSGDDNFGPNPCLSATNPSACFPGYLSSSNGVYKSIDGGLSWQGCGNLSSSTFQAHQILIHPTNQNILFAATTIGLFQTEDGGNNWTQISNIGSINLGNSNIWDLKFKPNDPNILYAAGNNTFYQLNFTTPTNSTSYNIPLANRISIGVTTANPLKVVLLAGPVLPNNTFNGIYSSNDSGITFSLLTQTPNVFSNQMGTPNNADQSGYDNCIVIDPNNENNIYVGGLCVWRSTDGGTNWTQISSYWSLAANTTNPDNPPCNPDDPYMHPDIHFLGFNHLNNKLYCGNDGGVYELYGTEWLSKFQGLSTSQFYHFEEENDIDESWGGCQDNGILQRVDGTLTFEEYSGGDGYDVMTDHPSRSSDGNSENIFFTVNSSIFTDCGLDGDPCRISVAQNVCNSCPNDFFGNLAMHPVDNEIIYVGYQTDIYRSINSGDVWVPLGGGRPGNWSICAGKNHTERLYVSGTNASMGTGIWRLDDATWSPIPLPTPYQPSQKISDIEIDRLDDDHVYASCAGTIENSKVYESTNAGVTWTNISFNIPQNEPVFCLLRDPSGGLYAGTTIGVYYKRADQNHWEPFYNDLPPVPVTQIVFEEEESIFVHCSTFGRGLWRTLKYNTDCVEDRNMTGPVSGRNYWEASNIITSTQIIEDSPGTHITYNAGEKVVLNPGLHAKLGTTLKVFSTGCGSQIDLSKPSKPKEMEIKKTVSDK